MNLAELRPKVVLDVFFLVNGQLLKKEVTVPGYELSGDDVLKFLERECREIGFDVEMETGKPVIVTYTKATVKQSVLSSDLFVGKEIFNRVIN